MGTLRPLARSVSDSAIQSLCHGFELGFPAVDVTSLAVSREFAFSSSSPDEFAFFYQASEMVSKFLDTSPEGSTQRRLAAENSFFAFEEKCRDTNGRMVDCWSRPGLPVGLLNRARVILKTLLGPFEWDEFPTSCGFGPGASSGLKRRESSHQNKWALSTHITERALPYYAAFRRWADLDLLPDRCTIVSGNKVTTVPKNYKIDRLIAIEPDWNAFLQHGVGSMIRRRLQRVGVLRPDAQDVNRALARLGSWTGSLATLDLRGASDCISLALCESLLPEDWYRVVYDLRSDQGSLGPLTITYEKVSSMGNGFTFELETLLFYALVLAVVGRSNVDRISVYGDDIICPSEHAAAVTSLLEAVGFEINSDKSFSSGPFRESCGGHFWQGKDVTPFYIRKRLNTVGDAIVLGNQLQRWASEHPRAINRVSGAFRVLRQNIPKALRGPWGVDGALWSSWDESCPRWNRDFQAYKQLLVARKSKYTDLHDFSGSYLHKLWNVAEDLEASRHATSLTVERLTRHR